MGIWNVMEKRDKRWKVISLKIISTGKYSHTQNFYKVVICGLVVAFVSLSCAIGVLDQNDPLFNAPIGMGQWRPTPLVEYTADIPIATEMSDPPAEVILPLPT